jgi:DNA polymerase-3 subunit beta
LPARKFLDICKALPEGSNIEVNYENERAVIRSGRSRFSLSCLPAKEFPKVEEISSGQRIRLSQRALRKIIDKTHFAMAQQDVRYYLNGLMVEIEQGNLRGVATDGHRLALCDESIDIPEGVNPQQVIIPRKAVLEILRLFEGTDMMVDLVISSNQIVIESSGIQITAKLVEGRFPDYQRVLPQNTEKTVIANRQLLGQAINRAAILSNERFRSLRVQIETGSMRITANNPEQEEAEEEIPITYEGGKLEIGFNASYLLDALGVIEEDDVKLELSDANSCSLIYGMGNEMCKYVIMPMRI